MGPQAFESVPLLFSLLSAWGWGSALHFSGAEGSEAGTDLGKPLILG